ncbi:MAG TPA: hypothetical protein VMV22_00310 [Acidimicrobiales bacterium]|nr:hypothetical protein [Acidimicrobiales bacterium]
MLFLHEVHEVKGAAEEEFESAFREGWMPALAADDNARLLWYCNHAHGSGPAYNVVTITALRDGAAWEGLARRIQSGDLSAWARAVDEHRHGVTGKLLFPVHWSPMAEIDLATVPTGDATHELSLYMEDTGWPHAAIDDYVEFWGTGYYEPMRQRAANLLDIQAVFQVAFGAGRRKEAILMQKIVNEQVLLHLLTHDTDPEHRRPGQFMFDALAFRDRWESKLLRTSSWSPLY